jgi:hypothetical protein
MKIIDFHVHPAFDMKQKPIDAAQKLLEWMDNEGISISVVLPVAPYISNDYIAELVNSEPKRLIGFASVVPNPADKAIEELECAINDLNLKGLKLHPDMQGFCLRHPHVWKVLKVAGKLKIPVLIHAMLGDFSSLYFKGLYTPWINTIEDYALLPFIASETTIILAHMGGSFHFEDFLQIASMDNVFVDTSYSLITVTEKIGIENFAKYIRALGANKFLFGSDYVLEQTPKEYGAKRQIEIIENLPITKEEKISILYRNAKELLRL